MDKIDSVINSLSHSITINERKNIIITGVKKIESFDDMEFFDHNKAIPTSASFVDSAIVQGEDGTVYHMCDACPSYMGLWSAGTYGKENGFIDGKLAVCDKTSAEKAESTKLNKEKY